MASKEKIMNPTHPGNEPDPGDMSTEPGVETPSEQPVDTGLPDDMGEKASTIA